MTARIQNHRIFLTGLLVYHFAACVSNDIYIPSMPHLRQVFNTDFTHVQDSMTAWYVGLCLPQLFFGPLADRFGRRPMLLTGCVVFFLASLGCMISRDVEHFTEYRFIQGLAVASLNITAFSTVRNFFEYKDAIRVFAWMSVVASSAPILGPIMGGYFLTLLSWRVDFGFLAIITFFAFGSLQFCAPETKHLSEPGQGSLLGTYVTILKNPIFVSNSFCYGILLGALITYLTSAPYVLIDELHYPPSHFGFVQCPIFLAGVFGGLVVSRCVKLFSARLTKLTGLTLIAIAIAGMFIANYFHTVNSVYLYIVPIVLFAFGFALAGSILTADALASLEVGIGSGGAMHGLMMALMGSLGSWSVGVFYHGHISDVATILIIQVAAALGCYLLIR